MTLFHIATTILGLVGWFLFANAPASAQESPIRGTIQRVLPQDGKEIIGRILVDKQAWVFVTKKTTIFKADGKNPPKPARFEDLKAGQRVQASFKSDIRDTDPPQVDADQILIVSDNEPTIRGAIMNVTELKETPRMVLVEEKAGDPNSTTWVHVTADTKIFKLTGKDRKAATFADLKVSVQIEARFNGDIAKTDPPQVNVDEILIIEDKRPTLRGIITEADKGGEGLLGAFLIAEKGGKPYDKVWLKITKDTQILKLDGKDRKAATFEDLKVGVRVEARSSGKFTEKNPPQTVVHEIVILPAQMK